MAVTRTRITQVVEEPKKNTEPSELADFGKAPQKKRRVRVGPGPWDAAPCTHLRWHLMGFFREKLALVQKVVTAGQITVNVTTINVRCTKCNTEMTLQAK